ncbi:MAG: PolC-type DNA polymerase III [Clostridia bacterium]|nr:PolC-type DNA polymerase III [Clostridia bacterium]
MTYPSFFDVFKKYEPTPEDLLVLREARDVAVSWQRDPLRVLVDAFFPSPVPHRRLSEIEEACRAFYDAQSFHIRPHFPPETVSTGRMPDVAEAAVGQGAATPGFFRDAVYRDDGETLTVEIPFDGDGVSVVVSTSAEEVLSTLIRERYGIVRRVCVTQSTDAAQQAEMRRASIRQIEHTYDAAAAAAAARELSFSAERAAPEPERPTLPRVAGLSDAVTRLVARDAFTYECGGSVYDVEHAQTLWGDPFTIDGPTPAGVFKGPAGNVIVLGTVYSVDVREIRQGERLAVSVGLSDGAGAICLRDTGEPEQVAWYKCLETGMHVAVTGRVVVDRYDGEPVLRPRAIAGIERVERTDDAAEKRVELHLHTVMSAMDAVIRPDELLDTVSRWGHDAVAVTDHGNVQSFPEILKLKRKKNLSTKILYGMEAYYVNDTARVLYGSDVPDFDDEMVVFDIETTGLSAAVDRIIEIGAVRIRAGEILDVYDRFVDPGVPIPAAITQLTSISDETVAGAGRIAEVLPEFLAYVGDRLLIAHNANFDVGFIRRAADDLGLPFSPTYLDTFALSRYLNPGLAKHKLDVVAEHYGLGDFHHHRASDDARMLALIFFRMQQQLRDEGVRTFAALSEAMSEKSDPLRLHPYHMILFARNEIGLRNLYQLVSSSYLDYFRRFPRIPKSLLDRHREGIIVGSACEAGELYRAILDNLSEEQLEEIASYYDYLEIQPLSNNRFLIAEGRVADEDALRDINRRIVALGDKVGRPVVATCDAHFLDRDQEQLRKILLSGMKMPDGDRDAGLYLRTTDEMLEEFSYLGEETAYRVVVKNTRLIASMIEDILPVPDGTFTPSMPGAEEELKALCYERAHAWYGDPLPDVVKQRLDRELTSIINNGFAVLYMIAQRLVSYSESLGYQVGSRGSVGSSFVATAAGISEVNPLPPHYRCPSCRHSEFVTDGSVGSGFDLPDRTCPVCGAPMRGDGHDIPFETFLGFKCDKSPDIDLNFSGDVQGRIHKYTEELFGEGHVFRAGTIGTLASKTAFGFVMKYLEEKGVSLPRAQVDYMVERLVGVKRTTGQHPGGIIVVPKEYSIYDFTPVQHPADDPDSDIITTHFQFSYLHDTILKLDELGHDIPTKYKMLERYTHTSVNDVKMNDRAVYDLFESCAPLGVSADELGTPLGTWGLPEFGTRFIVGVLCDAKPKNFADLLQISGLTHGTNVWLGNAKDLITREGHDISEVVGTRDSIMLTLLRYGLEPSMAFKIMEDVRKGKGLKPEQEAAMRENGVPDWYTFSCKKIKYLFPKSHAAAYVMSAIRLGWYKIHYPMEFYAAYLTVAPGGFDAEIVGGGRRLVKATVDALEKKGMDATQKEEEQLTCLQLVYEAMLRGVRFLPVDLRRSDARAFLPEDGAIRMPFNALSGVGDTAAQKIVEARDAGPVTSIEQLRTTAGLSRAVIDTLRRGGVLEGLSETNQIDIFSMI